MSQTLDHPPLWSTTIKGDTDLAQWLARLQEYVGDLERRVTTLEATQPGDFGAPVLSP